VPATDISQFEFRSGLNPGLSQNATATISGTSISDTIHQSASVTALIATFTTDGDSVLIGTVKQQSGVTSNDFTTPKTYTVYGSGTSKSYTVNVVLHPDTIPLFGTWKTAKTDTFTLIAGVDSLWLRRTADTTGARISYLSLADSLCVLHWPQTQIYNRPYQKMSWSLLSATSAVVRWFGISTSQTNALANLTVTATDTLTKQ
jgi:hypothetical protein